MKSSIYLFALIFLFIFSSCKTDRESNQNLVKEILFTKEGELSLFSKDSLVYTPITRIDIEVADDEYQVQTGLMYRESMHNNQGMLFIFEEEAPRSFYMKNTEFPLDIIFINSQKKIVSIQKNAQPFDETSLPSEKPAQFVLEVNATLSETWNLKPGDSISFTRM